MVEVNRRQAWQQEIDSISRLGLADISQQISMSFLFSTAGSSLYKHQVHFWIPASRGELNEWQKILTDCQDSALLHALIDLSSNQETLSNAIYCTLQRWWTNEDNLGDFPVSEGDFPVSEVSQDQRRCSATLESFRSCASQFRSLGFTNYRICDILWSNVKLIWLGGPQAGYPCTLWRRN